MPIIFIYLNVQKYVFLNSFKTLHDYQLSAKWRTHNTLHFSLYILSHSHFNIQSVVFAQANDALF